MTRRRGKRVRVTRQRPTTHLQLWPVELVRRVPLDALRLGVQGAPVDNDSRRPQLRERLRQSRLVGQEGEGAPHELGLRQSGAAGAELWPQGANARGAAPCEWLYNTRPSPPPLLTCSIHARLAPDTSYPRLAFHHAARNMLRRPAESSGGDGKPAACAVGATPSRR